MISDSKVAACRYGWSPTCADEALDGLTAVASTFNEALAFWNILCIWDAWPGVATDLDKGEAMARFLPMLERDLDGVGEQAVLATSS
jgi:hypothetical protein